MDRENSEGLQRFRLLAVLKDRRKVYSARRAGFCMLCRRRSVNEAALCDVCYTQLDDDEAKVAMTYISGQGP